MLIEKEIKTYNELETRQERIKVRENILSSSNIELNEINKELSKRLLQLNNQLNQYHIQKEEDCEFDSSEPVQVEFE